VKKNCNFCGESLKDSDKECPQCGWDRSQDGPPSSDPADQKARVGVAAALVVAYAVMWMLIQGTPNVARATPVARPSYAVADIAADSSFHGTVTPAIALGFLPAVEASTPSPVGSAAKALTLKVADAKSVRIEAHDALDYDFVVPDNGQKCALVGQLHGTAGFNRELETFLLTDDEYLFWHANQAAIPHSSWETIRGSETTLHYDLPGAGTYHLVVSNEMSPSSTTVEVRAQMKCAK
jgi:hypothetical protein